MNITAIDIEHEITNTERNNLDLLLELNLKHEIINVNEDFLSLTGFFKKDIIGVNLNKIKHPTMPNTIFSLIFGDIKNNKKSVFIMKNLSKRGRFFWTYNTVVPILDDFKRINGLKIKGKVIMSNNLDKIESIYSKLLDKEKDVYFKNPEQVFKKLLKEENINSFEDIVNDVINKNHKKSFFNFFNLKLF